MTVYFPDACVKPYRNCSGVMENKIEWMEEVSRMKKWRLDRDFSSSVKSSSSQFSHFQNFQASRRSLWIQISQNFCQINRILYLIPQLEGITSTLEGGRPTYNIKNRGENLLKKTTRKQPTMKENAWNQFFQWRELVKTLKPSSITILWSWCHYKQGLKKANWTTINFYLIPKTSMLKTSVPCEDQQVSGLINQITWTIDPNNQQ